MDGENEPEISNAADSAENSQPRDEKQSSSGEDSGEADSESEGESSRPPNKRARTNSGVGNYDPRVDALINHVSHLTNYLQSCAPMNLPSTSAGPSALSASSSMDFLVKPNCSELDLGEIHTLTDNTKVIKNAPQNRVEALLKLQHFNTEGWKEVKYSKVLQSFLAKPGFVELKINDELCHLNKGKDYLATTERAMAGLTNGLLEHKDIIRNNLQEIVNWANNSPTELTPNNLFDKIMTLFGPASQNYKIMEQMLQVVCGKRAECIEVRRERIISEVSNKNLQNTLRRLPPSVEHLFDHNTLMPVIQSLGGTNNWLNMPSYLKENKSVAKKRPLEFTSSSSAQSSQTNRAAPTFRTNKNKNFPKKFKKDSKTTNNSFRPKDKK